MQIRRGRKERRRGRKEIKEGEKMRGLKVTSIEERKRKEQESRGRTGSKKGSKRNCTLLTVININEFFSDLQLALI